MLIVELLTIEKALQEIKVGIQIILFLRIKRSMARVLCLLFANLIVCSRSFKLVGLTIASSLRRQTHLQAQKYDPSTFVQVSLLKPLGISLEEVEENGKKGVVIEEIGDGNAKLNGKLYKGLFLVSVNGVDLKYEDFDTILDALRSSPESEAVNLEFVDLRNVYRGPAVLDVEMPNGKTIKINCLKGQPMLDVLMGANVGVYGDRAKLTNCGGGGQCGTCAILVEDAEDWEERPTYEGLRLKKYPRSARLSCNTVIEGDCTVVISPAKIEY